MPNCNNAVIEETEWNRINQFVTPVYCGMSHNAHSYYVIYLEHKIKIKSVR
jgi:hypothetical protein